MNHRRTLRSLKIDKNFEKDKSLNLFKVLRKVKPSYKLGWNAPISRACPRIFYLPDMDFVPLLFRKFNFLYLCGQILRDRKVVRRNQKMGSRETNSRLKFWLNKHQFSQYLSRSLVDFTKNKSPIYHFFKWIVKKKDFYWEILFSLGALDPFFF